MPSSVISGCFVVPVLISCATFRPRVVKAQTPPLFKCRQKKSRRSRVACSSICVTREPHQIKSNVWGSKKLLKVRAGLDVYASTKNVRRQSSGVFQDLDSYNWGMAKHFFQEPENAAITAGEIEHSASRDDFARGIERCANYAAGDSPAVR